jgi:hypothetical protein
LRVGRFIEAQHSPVQLTGSLKFVTIIAGVEPLKRIVTAPVNGAGLRFRARPVAFEQPKGGLYFGDLT